MFSYAVSFKFWSGKLCIRRLSKKLSLMFLFVSFKMNKCSTSTNSRGVFGSLLNICSLFKSLQYFPVVSSVSGAVSQRCSVKTMFVKNSQNWRENRALFLITLQAEAASELLVPLLFRAGYVILLSGKK